MKNKDKFDVLNPFTGEVVDSVNNLSRTQVHGVLNDSLNFHCNLSSKERSEILLKTADYLKKNTNSLAQLISLESGLSLQDTTYEVGRVINCAKYSAKVCSLVERDITGEFVLDDVRGRLG